jgi:hypothetical protein
MKGDAEFRSQAHEAASTGFADAAACSARSPSIGPAAGESTFDAQLFMAVGGLRRFGSLNAVPSKGSNRIA